MNLTSTADAIKTNSSSAEVLETAKIDAVLKHHFIHAINHEIRSPINSIVNIAKLFAENLIPTHSTPSSPSVASPNDPHQAFPAYHPAPPPAQSQKQFLPTQQELHQALQLIQISGERVLELFNTALEFTTTTTFYEITRPAVFELDRSIDKITAATEHFTKNRPLELLITKDYPREQKKPYSLIGDERLLTQTLTYTLVYICSIIQEGSLHLTISSDTHHVQFEITSEKYSSPESLSASSARAFTTRSHHHNLHNLEEATPPNFSLLHQNIAKMQGEILAETQTRIMKIIITIPQILDLAPKTSYS